MKTRFDFDVYGYFGIITLLKHTTIIILREHFYDGTANYKGSKNNNKTSKKIDFKKVMAIHLR